LFDKRRIVYRMHVELAQIHYIRVLQVDVVCCAGGTVFTWR